MEFLSYCKINSKDTGADTILGDNLFEGQRRFLTTVFDALEQDIHKIYVLKSRQLGLSTISRALSVFYLGMHPGLPGSMVLDTDPNKQAARREIVTMIKGLPDRLKFPGIKGGGEGNRYGINLVNDATIQLFSAGVRESKSAGTLGRSVGLSMCHMSEICSFVNESGLEAFENSLSDVNPDRLYIYESTARGPNIWKDMWDEARKDNHCACVFLGWWSKPTQIIKKGDPDFEKYGLQPPDARELKNIKDVWDKYQHRITEEELAWVRRRMVPIIDDSDDSPSSFEGDTLRIQEQPWTEEQAFQMTGSTFFSPEALTEQMNVNVKRPKTMYYFNTGLEFVDTRVYANPPNKRMIELRVWEEPEYRDSVYVVAVDPAFGSNEKNDRSAIQILRCFADGVDQVAEYAWPLIGTRQLAWVVMSLCGWYAGENNAIYFILELNGPGMSVKDEIDYLRLHLSSGYQPKQVDEQGLKNVFRNVRNYIYTRPDSMTPGRNYHWKTTPGAGPSGKVRLMEGLRNYVSNGMLRIRSLEVMQEMEAVRREGDEIATQGRKKDDRVIGLALGVRCWEERVRRAMSSNKRTREAEAAKKSMSIVDQASLYSKNQLDSFFAQKRQVRNQALTALRRQSWRSR